MEIFVSKKCKVSFFVQYISPRPQWAGAPMSWVHALDLETVSLVKLTA